MSGRYRIRKREAAEIGRNYTKRKMPWMSEAARRESAKNRGLPPIRSPS